MKNSMVVMAVMMSLMLGNVVSSEAVTNSVEAQVEIVGAQKYYTPNKDENLSIIAQIFQVSVDDILRENPQIKNKHMIFAGTQIKLPLYTAPPTATFSVPVPVKVEVTQTSIKEIINNPTKEVRVVDETLTWTLSGLVLVILLGAITWLRWPKKTNKNVVDTTVKPSRNETQVQYEKRCKSLPKDTRVACFFGCKSGREGMTAKSVVSHHCRCNDNPNALHIVNAA